MNRKFLTSIIIVVILVAGGVFVFLGNKDNQPPKKQENEIVLFYGEGCPHCAKVEEFIKENKVDEKFSFERKEVYNDKNNAQELSEKALNCGLATASIGVPFLWDGSRCIIGDVDIIDFLKEKANVQ